MFVCLFFRFVGGVRFPGVSESWSPAVGTLEQPPDSWKPRWRAGARGSSGALTEDTMLQAEQKERAANRWAGARRRRVICGAEQAGPLLPGFDASGCDLI